MNRNKRNWKHHFGLLVWIISKYTYLLYITEIFRQVNCAHTIIKIRDADVTTGTYRLDYTPPYGYPSPNQTFFPEQVTSGILLDRLIPGSDYEIKLYYSNSTVNDIPARQAHIRTEPDIPTNLSIEVNGTNTALVSWGPPKHGGYTKYILKMISLSEKDSSPVYHTIEKDAVLPFRLADLVAGASYELHLFTVYEQKESQAYISSNFTTFPTSPGRFIVWFRNGTTMLVLWQPPYPAGIYSHYEVSITPPDALNSIQIIEKKQHPPGPAQAAFTGLVPGRGYSISVATVSNELISKPTTGFYHTIPPMPLNITFDPASITTNSFVVTWSRPEIKGEYDQFRIKLKSYSSPDNELDNLSTNGTGWKTGKVLDERDMDKTAEPQMVYPNPTFEAELMPGRTYNIEVKSIAQSVVSWPASKNVTLRPLPVQNVTHEQLKNGTVFTQWTPQYPLSQQDLFKVVYQEETDSRVISTDEYITSDLLYPGRNYSIAVYAISNGMESKPTIGNILTRPASPIIEELTSVGRGFKISWKSDVNSRQDEFLVDYTRNDTGKNFIKATKEPRVNIADLLAGVTYKIEVYAISHGMKSEPYVQFRTIQPNPVQNLTITDDIEKNSVVLRWDPPVDSLFSYYIIRYKTENSKWLDSSGTNQTKKIIRTLEPGEKFTIQVVSVSNQVETLFPQEVEYTLQPNPVHSVTPKVDSRNITFEWPRPEGAIEDYIINWYYAVNNTKAGTKKIPGVKATGGYNRTLNATIGDLFPGMLYNFEIQTKSHGISSEIFPITVRTKPIFSTEIFLVKKTRTLQINYIPTPPTVSKIDKYKFQLIPRNYNNPEDIQEKEQDANHLPKKVEFDNLIPGRFYNIYVSTVSGNQTSVPIERHELLHPDPVKRLNATHISGTEITLSWDRPYGDFDSFDVQYLNTNNELEKIKTEDFSVTITNLRPHRNYTFTILTVAGTDEPGFMRVSDPVSARFTTHESTPGRVKEFSASEVFPNYVHFKWNLAAKEKNGVLLDYLISYRIKGTKDYMKQKFEPQEREGFIRGLIPGEEYEFRIQARTKIGSGQIGHLEQRMPVWAPPKPNTNSNPSQQSKTDTTITIRFRKNYFSDTHGEVSGYAVIVAEDTSKEISQVQNMLSWNEILQFNSWPPYQANERYYPFYNNSGVADFTIGDEKVCNPKKKYCNGPLKPGTPYRVKIRGYTAPNLFEDTYWSDPIVTDKAANTVAIVFGVLSGIALIGVVAAFFVHKRRLVCGSLKEHSKSVMARGEEIPFPSNLIIESRPCKLVDFPDHYRFMSADSDFRFADEYEALTNIGRHHPTTAAELPVNKAKNRFTNILPYDHSRVKLTPADDEEGSDYINANFVPGFNSPREYIVTQGPLESTKDDFWRMCWETNSVAIIMLTRTIEKGREKCCHYWPYDTKPVTYDEIEVTVIEFNRYPNWSVSEFMLRKGERTRNILHYYFTTWPDFGVPDPPQTLVRFVRAYRERVNPDSKPVIVHCSAGVGRSGTFIALDRILQSIQHDYVDIFGIVCEMRNERVHMVQNETQYICIHQCLLAVLEGRENESLEQHDNQGFDDDEGIVESGM